MKSQFKKTVRLAISRTKTIQPGILQEADLQHLPAIVQRYIRQAGFVGKEKIVNFRATFTGGIRFAPGEPYMPLKSVQYNFLNDHSRLFYIVAKKKGIPALGLHLYRDGKAIFRIKVLGLFTVVDAKGPKMDQGETVTVLNDIFFMAPGALTDPRIGWESIDDLTVKATFRNGAISVSAEVTFSEEGEILNFISHDRFETNGKTYISNPWETPVSEYREVNGYHLPSKARLIYKRPDGDFCYGEFELESMKYNVTHYYR